MCAHVSSQQKHYDYIISSYIVNDYKTKEVQAKVKDLRT